MGGPRPGPTGPMPKDGTGGWIQGMYLASAVEVYG